MTINLEPNAKFKIEFDVNYSVPYRLFSKVGERWVHHNSFATMAGAECALKSLIKPELVVYYFDNDGKSVGR